jgi:hypothetical protein
MHMVINHPRQQERPSGVDLDIRRAIAQIAADGFDPAVSDPHIPRADGAIRHDGGIQDCNVAHLVSSA